MKNKEGDPPNLVGIIPLRQKGVIVDPPPLSPEEGSPCEPPTQPSLKDEIVGDE